MRMKDYDFLLKFAVIIFGLNYLIALPDNTLPIN
jgi:hypothetical protein